MRAFAVQELSESEPATVDRAIAHLDGLVAYRVTQAEVIDDDMHEADAIARGALLLG